MCQCQCQSWRAAPRPQRVAPTRIGLETLAVRSARPSLHSQFKGNFEHSIHLESPQGCAPNLKKVRIHGHVKLLVHMKASSSVLFSK